MVDFYKILEVDDNASQEEIKKSYRKLSLIHHPDKNPGDQGEKFKAINEAYETLGDPGKRNEYNMSRRNPFMGGMPPGMGGMSPGMGGPNMGGMPPGMGGVDDIFKMFFGGQMPHGVHSMGGGFPGMNGNVRVFRNGQPVDVNALNKPTPIIKNVVISLEQAYKGDQVPVQIERWLFEDDIRKIENETLYIPIMKGIDDKEMIILRDKGNVLKNDLRGDVKIIINIQNTTVFKRDGLNLHLDKEITLKESLCGFDFIINHISGKQLRFNSESGTPMRDGLIKAIPGFGLERENNKGNLCIKFTVKYPEKLSAEQIKSLKEIL